MPPKKGAPRKHSATAHNSSDAADAVAAASASNAAAGTATAASSMTAAAATAATAASRSASHGASTPTSPHIPPSQESTPEGSDEGDVAAGGGAAAEVTAAVDDDESMLPVPLPASSSTPADLASSDDPTPSPSPPPQEDVPASQHNPHAAKAAKSSSHGANANASASQAAFSSRAPRTADSPVTIGTVAGGAAGGRSSPSASPTRELDGDLSRQARALAAEDVWRRRLGFPSVADTPLCDIDKVDHVVDRTTFQAMVESYFRPVEYIDLLKIGQLKVLLQSMPTTGGSTSTTTSSSSSSSTSGSSTANSSGSSGSSTSAAADVKKVKTEPESSSTNSATTSRASSIAARAGSSASASSGSTVPASALASSSSSSSSSTSAVPYSSGAAVSSSSSSSSSSANGPRSGGAYSAPSSSSTSSGHTHSASGAATCACCQPTSSAASSSSSSSASHAPPPRPAPYSSPSSSASYSSGSSHSTYSNSSYSSNTAAAAPYSSGSYSQQHSYSSNYSAAGMASYSSSAYSGSYAPLVGYPPYGAAGYAASYGAMQPYSSGTPTSTASLYSYTQQQAAAAAAAAAGYQAAALSSHLTGSLLSTTSAPSYSSSQQQASASSGRNNQSSYGSSHSGNYSAAPYSSGGSTSHHHHVPYSHSGQSSQHHYGSSSGGSYSSSVSSSSRTGSSSGSSSSAQYPLPPRVHSSQFVSVLQALRGVSSSLSHLPVTCLPPSYMTPPTYWDPSMVLPPLGLKPDDQIAINLPASPSAPTPTCTPPNPDIKGSPATAMESVAPMPHLPQYTEFPHLSLMLGLTVHPDSVCIPHSQALLTSATAASSSSGQANSNTIPGTASWAPPAKPAAPAPAAPTKSQSTAGAAAAPAPYSSGQLHSHSSSSGFSAPYSSASSSSGSYASSHSSSSAPAPTGTSAALQLTLAAHPYLSPTKDLSVPVLFTMYSGPDNATSSSSSGGMDSTSAVASSTAPMSDSTTRSLSVSASTSDSAPVSVLVDYLASGLSASVAPLASSISAAMSSQLAAIHPRLTLMNFVTVAQQAKQDPAAGVGYSVEERQVDKYWKEFKEAAAASAAASSSSAAATSSSSSASKSTKAGATSSASSSSSSATTAAASSSSSTAAASSTAATAASSSSASAAASSSSSADAMTDVPATSDAAKSSTTDDVPALETSSGGAPRKAVGTSTPASTASASAAPVAAAGDAGSSALSSSLIMQLVQFVELEARHAAAQRVKEMEIEEAEAKAIDEAAAANRLRIKAEGGASATADESAEEQFDMEIDTSSPGLTLNLPHSLVPAAALENLPALPPTPEPLEHDSVLHELLLLQYYLYLQSSANRARALSLRGQVMLQHQSLYIEKRIQWMRTIHETYACATLWQTLRLQLKKGVRDVPIPAALMRQSHIKMLGEEQSKAQAEADRLQREREEHAANVLGLGYTSGSASTARGVKNEPGSSKQSGSAAALPLLLDDAKSVPPARAMDDLALKSEAEIEAELAAGETGDEDYSVCCVCFDGESKEGNPIIYCDRCNVSVHQRCWGLRTVPDEEGWVWYCSWCQAWRDKLKAIKAREKEQEKARIRAAAAQALLPAGHQLSAATPPPSQSPTPTNVTPTLPTSGSSSNLSSSGGGPPSLSSDIHSASGLVKKGSVARGGSTGGASGPRSSPPPPASSGSSSASPMNIPPNMSPDPAMFHQIASYPSTAGAPSNPYICALCPSSGGVFKPASDMFDASGDPVWVHIVCALWVPKARIMNTRNMEPISVAPALKIQSQHPRQCSICKLTYGACVPCSHDDCNTYFHPLCAWYEGLSMFVEVVEIDCRFLLYCLRHTPKSSLEHLQTHAPGELPPQQAPMTYHEKCVLRARQQREIRQRGRAHHSEKTREKRRKRQYLERRRKERARAMREDLYEVGRCAVCFQTNEEQAHSKQYDEIRRREQQAAAKGATSASAVAAAATAAQAANPLSFLVHGIAPAASVKNRLLHCEECDIEVHQCCISGDALVALSNGFSRPICEVPAGTQVLSFDARKGGHTSVATSALLDQGWKLCVELLFSDGRTVTCTPDHRFLQPDGSWVEAQHMQLHKSEIVAGLEYPTLMEDTTNDKRWTLPLTESLGFDLDLRTRSEHALAFAGLLGYASICAEDSAVRLRHALDVEWMLRDIQLLTGEKGAVTAHGTRFAVELPIALRRTLFAVSLGAASLPPFLLHSSCPLSVIQSFLGGLFGAAGRSPQRCGRSFSGVRLSLRKRLSVQMVEQLQALFKRLGIEESGSNLSAVTTLRFASTIGFRYCCQKAMRLTAAVCFQRWQERFQNPAFEGVCDLDSDIDSVLQACDAAKFLSRDHGVPADAQALPTFRVKLVGRRPLPAKVHVWDLTVPGTENFTAQGLGAHNCYGVTDAEYDELQKRVHVETLNQNMNALAAANSGSSAGAASGGPAHVTSGADSSSGAGWHCRRCQQSTSADKDVSCALCPRKGGAFKKTITGRWAHVVCALYTPETFFSDPVRLEPIEGVSEIPKPRRRLLCSLCNRPGICVQCSEPGCQVLFHPTCGLFSGVYMGVLETPQPAAATAPAAGATPTGTTGADGKAVAATPTTAGSAAAGALAVPAASTHLPYSYKCYCKKHTPLHLSRFVSLPHSYTKLLKLKFAYESCKTGLDRLRLWLKKRGTELKEETDYEELVWKESRMEATTGVKSKKLKPPKAPRGRKNAPPAGASLGSGSGTNPDVGSGSGSGSGSGGMSSPPKTSGTSSSSTSAAVARKHKNAAQLGLGLGAPNLMDPNHAQQQTGMHQPYGSTGSAGAGTASSPRITGTGAARGRPNKSASSSTSSGGGGGSGSGPSNNNTPLLMSQQQLGQALGGYSSSVDQAAQAQAQALAQGILAASGLGGLAAFGPFGSLGSSASSMGMGMGSGGGGLGGMQLSGSGSGGNQNNSGNSNLMMTQSQLELALLGDLSSALRGGVGVGLGAGGNKNTGRGGGGGGGRGNTGGGGGGKLSNKSDSSSAASAAAAASFNHAVQQSMVSSSLENQANLHQWLSLLDSSNASAALAAAAAAASVSTGSGGGSAYGNASNNPYAAYGGLNNFNLSAAIYQQLAAASAQIPGLSNMLAAANSSALNQQLLSQFMSPTQSAISTPPTSTSSGPSGSSSGAAFHAASMTPINLQSPMMTGSSGGVGSSSSGNSMLPSSNLASGGGSSSMVSGSGSSAGLAGLISSHPIDLSVPSSLSSYNPVSSSGSGSSAQPTMTTSTTNTVSAPSAPKRKVDEESAASSSADTASKRAKGESSADVSAGNANTAASIVTGATSTSGGVRPLVGGSASPRLSPRFSSATVAASALPLSPAGSKRGAKGPSRSRPTSPSGPGSPTLLSLSSPTSSPTNGPRRAATAAATAASATAGGKSLSGSKRKAEDEDADAADSESDEKRGAGTKRARSKQGEADASSSTSSVDAAPLSPLVLPSAPLAPAFSVDEPVLILQDDQLYDATVIEVQPCLTLLRANLPGAGGAPAAVSSDGPFTIRGYTGPQPTLTKKQPQLMPPDDQWWAFHCHFKGWNKRHDLWLTSSQILARTPAAIRQQAAMEKKKKA